MKRVALVLLSIATSFALAQPPAIKLWRDGAPGAPRVHTPETVRISDEGERIVSNIDEPAIIPFLPSAATATGAAVLVIPGGGHREIWMDHEGYNVAAFLTAHGVAAFILKYRLAKAPGSHYTVEGTSLGDTQRAIRTIRSRSKEWAIDPQRIGVIGFSAGGELAALASTRYDTAVAAPSDFPSDAINAVSAKPNFQALVYPLIPSPANLTSATPPAFLVCGGADDPAISQGLAQYYLALSRLHVPAELHIYGGVGHGFGIRARNTLPVSAWPDLFLEWLESQHLLQPSTR